MNTYINIIKGPLKGFRFKALPGITIGGPESHINVKDVSVAGIHARIIHDENKQLYIKAESTNAEIYLNDKQVKQGHLSEKTKIQIGDTVFIVTMRSASEPTETEDEDEQESDTDQWLAVIKKKYRELSKLDNEKPINLSVLEPAVNLHFIKGMQLKTDWVLGYGPRIIGPESVDLKIFEKNAPSICFELIPTKKGILYQTEHKKDVLLNKKHLKQQILKDKDRITIFNTEILVNLLK